MWIKQRNFGFSLPEVAIVVSIGLILSAIAIPNMLTVIANAQLRGNIGSLSGVFQMCRMAAVNQNRTMSTHFATASNGIMGYVKQATDNSAVAHTDPQVEMEAPIVEFTTPTGTGAPAAISTTTLGFTPLTSDPSFNSRGVPCTYSSGTCTNSGFIYYYKDTRRTGNNGWSCVSISPAGRITKWFWNGSAWTQ